MELNFLSKFQVEKKTSAVQNEKWSIPYGRISIGKLKKSFWGMCIIKSDDKNCVRWPYNVVSELPRNGILLPKLFWPTVRRNCSSNRERKTFEIQGLSPRICKNFEITKQFIQTVKGQNNFW